MSYTAETSAKIVKHACNKAAAKKYSSELGHSVAEGMVRNIKRRYLELLKSVGDPDAITSLPNAMLGRLIGKFDDEVVEYINNLRPAGGIVNSNIVIAVQRVLYKNPGLLKDYGGSLELGKKWAESFLLRRGYAKRKATKAARKIPSDLPELKLKRIHGNPYHTVR